MRLIGKPSNKRHVTEGRIEKRKIKLHNYKVSYTSPLTGKKGFPLLEHLADDEFACWDDYITHMARDGTYGDQITPYAAANLCNIDIQIISTLGVGRQHVFSPIASVSAATVYLGHFAENQGEQYVSLEQVVDHNDASGKEYDANDPGEGEISED